VSVQGVPGVPEVPEVCVLKVHRWNPEIDGELTEKALRTKLEAQGYSVSRYVYSPGTHFSEHTHNVDKIDAVLSGRFELTLGGAPVVLGPGDWIPVPRGVRHTATVVGDEPVVSLDAVKNR
jgi:quercetin dioxygenase-like cupin family protein